MGVGLHINPDHIYIPVKGSTNPFMGTLVLFGIGSHRTDIGGLHTADKTNSKSLK